MSHVLANLFVLGNPLIDICVSVTQEFLNEYELLNNDAILAKSEHLNLYDDIVAMAPVYRQGGSSLNSAVVAQWILGDSGNCVYTGSISNDEYGKILEEKVRAGGVTACFYYADGPEPTGSCACLINGNDRSLVTRLGAANSFSVSHLEKADVWKYVQAASVYYVTAFVLPVCAESVLKIAKYSATSDTKTFCLNLSATFLSEHYFDLLRQVLPFVNIFFANDDEINALAEKMGCKEYCLKDRMKKLLELPLQAKNPLRMIFATRGSDSVLCAMDGNVLEFSVESLDPHYIVDTIGAGDAFVGGFLAQFVQSKSLDECVRCALWASKVIIGQVGCSVPTICDYR